jgi:long-chain fatty acid transport protein
MCCRPAASRAVIVLVIALAAASPGLSAGFALFTQGAKASAMGDGAFVAQADDGSAMFFNVAGLGFQKERSIEFGGTLIKPADVDFSGRAPFPGPTQSARGAENVSFPIHFSWVEPLGERTTFGLGVHAPFGLRTEWEDRDEFSGRFLSYYADIVAYDVNPSFAWQATEEFSVGVGVIARLSSWKQRRRLAQVNPFTGLPAEVADANLTTDMGDGYGWNAGILHRPTSWFSWGLSYRSQIDVEYEGETRLLQLTSGDFVFDQLVAAVIPFDERPRFENELAFPDMAAVGLAFRISPRVLMETDVNWMGWDSFETIDLTFPDDPDFDETNPQDYEDSVTYRIGFEILSPTGSAWRFGYAADESPQPDSSVSPLLPDADRHVYTFGWGREGTEVDLDLALLWVDLGRRTTASNSSNFNGVYESDAVLLAMTLGF